MRRESEGWTWGINKMKQNVNSLAMVNRSWMTCRCAAANSCGVWNKEEEREEESLPGEVASSWQPRLGAQAAAPAAFQSQMSLINSSASQFIPILGDQTRIGKLQKFEEA